MMLTEELSRCLFATRQRPNSNTRVIYTFQLVQTIERPSVILVLKGRVDTGEGNTGVTMTGDNVYSFFPETVWHFSKQLRGISSGGIKTFIRENSRHLSERNQEDSRHFSERYQDISPRGIGAFLQEGSGHFFGRDQPFLQVRSRHFSGRDLYISPSEIKTFLREGSRHSSSRDEEISPGGIKAFLRKGSRHFSERDQNKGHAMGIWIRAMGLLEQFGCVYTKKKKKTL